VEKMHFCSGMPRSGSTLLMNILAQNPKFYASATSGLCDMVREARNFWDKLAEFQAMREEESQIRKGNCLRGMLRGYYENEENIVIDKSRGWLAEIELLNALMVSSIKILVPVRPLMDILSSFEKLYRAKKALGIVPQEAANAAGFATVEGRCSQLLNHADIVGSAFNRVKDALARGHREQMYFVEYDRLTRIPKTVLGEIYEFLDEEPYAHDFENVKQATKENDRVYGWGDLHTIRPTVRPVESDWQNTLSPYMKPVTVNAIQGDNVFWRAGGV